jgi:putative peptidoglycan lipid II flippase
MPQPGWGQFFAKLMAAMVMLGATLMLLVGPDSLWLASSSLTRVLRLSLLVVGGMGVYFATLFILGFRVADFRRSGAH